MVGQVPVHLLWFKFILYFNFVFLLFLGMVMHDCHNEFETMQIKFKPRIKLNHNIFTIKNPPTTKINEITLGS